MVVKSKGVERVSQNGQLWNVESGLVWWRPKIGQCGIVQWFCNLTNVSLQWSEDCRS
jgi:hypothetical protein